MGAAADVAFGSPVKVRAGLIFRSHLSSKVSISRDCASISPVGTAIRCGQGWKRLSGTWTPEKMLEEKKHHSLYKGQLGESFGRVFQKSADFS
jgi:hypothetical protein